MMIDERAAWDACTLAAQVKARAVSPMETVERAFEAMARLDPFLQAFCTPAYEEARQTALALDARLARGGTAGALAGVPVAIKDLVFTRGLRTTFGSRLYADFVPDDDDIVVERLKAADAIIIGKTNAAEFGYGGCGHNPLFATTRNPWDLRLTPGGSSAGSAAAVAAGICPIALGSDGGGSIRLPAAFTGIVGIKPSMGRLPLWPGCRDARLPGASGWESIEHVGPLSRSVADAALMLDVMAGPDARDRRSIPDEGVGWRAAVSDGLPKDLRIAFCPNWADLPVDPEVRAIAAAAARSFETDLGCHVEVTPSPFGNSIDVLRAITAMETDLTGLRALARGREDWLSPGLRALLRKNWSAEMFTDAITQRKAAAAAIARFMEHFDLILTPTVPVVAFAIDRDGPGEIAGVPVEDDAWTPCLYPANLTGQPAASVPAGFTGDGLPVGLQIIGPHLDDRRVIAAAAAFERIRPWADRHPPHSVWRALETVA